MRRSKRTPKPSAELPSIVDIIPRLEFKESDSDFLINAVNEQEKIYKQILSDRDKDTEIMIKKINQKSDERLDELKKMMEERETNRKSEVDNLKCTIDKLLVEKQELIDYLHEAQDQIAEFKVRQEQLQKDAKKILDGSVDCGAEVLEACKAEAKASIEVEELDVESLKDRIQKNRETIDKGIADAKKKRREEREASRIARLTRLTQSARKKNVSDTKRDPSK